MKPGTGSQNKMQPQTQTFLFGRGSGSETQERCCLLINQMLELG